MRRLCFPLKMEAERASVACGVPSDDDRTLFIKKLLGEMNLNRPRQEKVA